jgi:hypothetical protein
MSKYYIYKMNILDNPLYFGSYIGQHKIGKKEPMKDGYKGSGSDWKKYILSNHVPVEKEILCMCESIEEANKMEDYYINQYKDDGIYLWNRCKGGGNHQYDRLYTEEELKEHKKQWGKRYKEANKEKIAKQDKLYRETHKEQRKQYDKQYREAHKEEIKQYREDHKEHYEQYHKRWQKDHEEDLKNYRKQWYEDHREEAQEQRKEYYKNNKDRFSQWAKEYRENNKEKYSQYHKQYSKQWYEANKEQRKQYDKQYKSQLCEYNGKTITLHGLECRFRRMGIEHPILEAKKYLIEQEVA